MSHRRAGIDDRSSAIERDLALMSALALSRLTDALHARESGDEHLAARVVSEDDEMDDLCLRVEEAVFRTQILEAPVARDQWLLHVARIVCVALERVGDLASAVAGLTHARPADCAAAPRVQRHLDELTRLALDGLRATHEALSHGESSGLGLNAARAAAARQALRDLVTATSACSHEAPRGPWPGETVLLGRHLERTADNAKEIARRLLFLEGGPPPGASGARTARLV